MKYNEFFNENIDYELHIKKDFSTIYELADLLTNLQNLITDTYIIQSPNMDISYDKDLFSNITHLFNEIYSYNYERKDIYAKEIISILKDYLYGNQEPFSMEDVLNKIGNYLEVNMARYKAIPILLAIKSLLNDYFYSERCLRNEKIKEKAQLKDFAKGSFIASVGANVLSGIILKIIDKITENKDKRKEIAHTVQQKLDIKDVKIENMIDVYNDVNQKIEKATIIPQISPNFENASIIAQNITINMNISVNLSNNNGIAINNSVTEIADKISGELDLTQDIEHIASQIIDLLFEENLISIYEHNIVYKGLMKRDLAEVMHSFDRKA